MKPVDANTDYGPYNEAWDTYEQTRTELSVRFANLYLVASADTQSAADEVSTFFDRIASREMTWAENEFLDDNGGDGSKRDAYYDKLDEIPNLLRDFIKSAKNDIGVYGG